MDALEERVEDFPSLCGVALPPRRRDSLEVFGIRFISRHRDVRITLATEPDKLGPVLLASEFLFREAFTGPLDLPFDPRDEKVGYQADFGSRMSSKGLPMRGYDPRGMDKYARAVSAAAKIEAGRVFFPHNVPWLSEFLSELESFPGGRWDDQCDAFAQLLAYMDKKTLTADSIRLVR